MKKLGRIQTFAVAGLSALALAAPVALAQTTGNEQGTQRQGAHERHGEGGGRDGGGRGGHFGGREMFRGLELTDAQKASLKQIHQSFGERTKSLREQLRAKHEELRQSESGGTFNEALATQKLTEAASLQAKLMGEEFRMRQESLAILTPEQKTQIEQRRAEFKAKREQFKTRRGEQRQQQQ
ncbi:MAG: Spy/CpxP family protein refolding chaperone [Pyrinomonadaceae bacterium]